MKTRTNQPIELFSTDDIEHLSDSVLNELKCGDIITKQTGNLKHTYVVSYKEEKHGICLSYFACGYLETISYDYINGHWVFNSKDVCLVPEDKTLVLENVSFNEDGQPVLTSANNSLIYQQKPQFLLCKGELNDEIYTRFYIFTGFIEDSIYYNYLSYLYGEQLYFYPYGDDIVCEQNAYAIKNIYLHKVNIRTDGQYSNYSMTILIPTFTSDEITTFSKLKYALKTTDANIASHLPSVIQYKDVDDTANHFYYISSFTSSALELKAIDTPSKTIVNTTFVISDSVS